MDILRFMTAGSVDDGKSTLIGRLLYDSKSIMTDHLEAIEKQNRFTENGNIDLALLTDGLRAEREQGITIDVAYKYFATPKRKFIIADAPGHVQYTRNMVTGASNSDLVIILVDARNGVVEQTRRHAMIASLLNIPHVIVAVNKMDMVNYDANIYNDILIDFAHMAKELSFKDVQYIPISAMTGDNIVDASEAMPWYEGQPLLSILETVKVDADVNLVNARFPVQYVIRPQTAELHDFRGYAGKITSGIYAKGDEVVILPSGRKSKISSVLVGNEEKELAFAPQSVTILLEDDVDVSRGDLIVKAEDQAKLKNEFEVELCWMDEKPLLAGNKYLLQINSRQVRAAVKEIVYKINVNTMKKEENPAQVFLNDLVKIQVKTASPVAFDSFSKLRSGGAGIFIDETSHATVAACMIV